MSGVKWPDVPACYGWLSLTQRGEWRLGEGRQASRVSHGGMLDFINRHYAAAEAGAWCVHNGPQKVYVTLEYTPWIWHLSAGALLAHTGVDAGEVSGAWLDEDGSLLLLTRLGIGVLDDRDLPACLSRLCDSSGAALGDDALEDLGNGKAPPRGVGLHWGDAILPVDFIQKAEVPGRFGFTPQAPSRVAP